MLKSKINICGLLIAILLLIQCTLDKSLIYRKEYIVNKNNFLEFNGFYTISNKRLMTSLGYKEFMFPIFFYEDGSVIIMNAYKDTIQLKQMISDNPKGVWGYWGNYQINNDTITIEYFVPNINSLNHERNLRRGLINKDRINLYQEVDRKGNIIGTNEVISFIKLSIKPDSTANWIRKKRKFNR